MSLGRSLLPLLLLSCRGHASADDCAAMKDRYLDLAVKESQGAASLSPAQAAAVREVERGLKRAEPSYRAVEDACAAVTRAEVRCALGADSTRAWEACVRAGDAR